MIRPARVAVYGGGGSPFHHAAALAADGHLLEFVFPPDIRAGVLEGFDVFAMPGGAYRAMLGHLEPLGPEGARAIAKFVAGGGMFTGSCAGAYIAATVARSFVEACPFQPQMQLTSARVWNEADGEFLGMQSPGVGRIRVRTVLPDHPVMEGMPESFQITHYNGPFFRGGEALLKVAGTETEFTPAERFLDRGESARLMIDSAVAEGVADLTVDRYDRGRVVLFGSHPEFGFSLGMDDDQAPVRMLRNAVRWQVAEAPDRRPHVAVRPGPVSDGSDPLEHAAELGARSRAAIDWLAAREDQPVWLQPAHAIHFFGLSASEIWRRSLALIPRYLAEVESTIGEVDPAVVHFRQPADETYDGGYHGVLALLEQVARMLELARANWTLEPGRPSRNPYHLATSNPYHLVAGSYLSAAGRAVGAALLCRSFRTAPAYAGHS